MKERGELPRPRQRVLDAYYPQSIRVVIIYQHGQMTPVGEDHFKRARGKVS